MVVVSLVAGETHGEIGNFAEEKNVEAMKEGVQVATVTAMMVMVAVKVLVALVVVVVVASEEMAAEAMMAVMEVAVRMAVVLRKHKHLDESAAIVPVEPNCPVRGRPSAKRLWQGHPQWVPLWAMPPRQSSPASWGRGYVISRLLDTRERRNLTCQLVGSPELSLGMTETSSVTANRLETQREVVMALGRCAQPSTKLGVLTPCTLGAHAAIQRQPAAIRFLRRRHSRARTSKKIPVGMQEKPRDVSAFN